MLVFFLQNRPEPVLPNLQLNAKDNHVDVHGNNCYFEVPQNWTSENKESLGMSSVPKPK
jgi:hypothetical protein